MSSLIPNYQPVQLLVTKSGSRSRKFLFNQYLVLFGLGFQVKALERAHHLNFELFLRSYAMPADFVLLLIAWEN